MTELTVISADSHVLEPHDLWTARLAGGPFADRAPQMVEDENHGHVFVIDGLRPFPIGLAGAAGKSSTELRWHRATRPSRCARAAGTRSARLADMDTDGVAAEVLYPSVGMTLAQSKDRDYQLACIRAYNDWLVEYCAGGNGRLVGLAMIPTIDLEAAVDEIERAHDAGLRGAMVPGMPAEGHYAEERFDPMWAAFAERDCRCRSTSSPAPWAATRRSGRGSRMMTVMSIVQQMQQTLALLIFGGVFDRHPALRVVSAEHDAGWVAHFAYRLDQMYERHHNWLGRKSAGLERPAVASTCGRTAGTRSRRTRWRSRPASGSASIGSCGPATTRTRTRPGRTRGRSSSATSPASPRPTSPRSCARTPEKLYNL